MWQFDWLHVQEEEMRCPKCNSDGLMLFTSFECNNPNCGNYKEPVKTLTINASGSGNGCGYLILNADDCIDFNVGAVELDAGSPLKWDGTTWELNCDSGLEFSVGGTILPLDGTDTTNLTMTAGDASEKILPISAINASADCGNLILKTNDSGDE